MTTSSPQKTPPPPKEPHRAADALASLRIERPDPSIARRSRRRWLILAVVSLALIGGAAWVYRSATGEGDSPSWLGGSSQYLPEIMQNRIEVRLASVTVQTGRAADAVVVATGYLESRRQARIGARAAGRIDKVLFEEGNRVRKGEILAELDHKDLDASLAAAAASVARAKSAMVEQKIAIEQALADKKRADKLWESSGSIGIAAAEYDQVKFGYQSAVARKQSLEAEIALAEAQKQQAEQLKENMFIRAPFDGTVISKDAEVGESILPGGMGGGSGRGSVATIADLDNLEIECDVQEDFISRVREGQQADIAVDAVQDKKYRGTVRKIIPMGDRARATIKVKVTIDDADQLLFPEMAGTVFFLPSEQESDTDDQPRIFCPTTAVEEDDQGNQFVWIVDEEKLARQIAVQAGEDRDGRTEVFQGLSGNERVVVDPQELHQGAPVRIAQ